MSAMGIQIVTVVGGGTMGNGIAHVCALSGREVRITDVSQEVVDRALATISKNMDRQVKKEFISEAERDVALERIRPMTDLDVAADDSHLMRTFAISELCAPGMAYAKAWVAMPLNEIEALLFMLLLAFVATAKLVAKVPVKVPGVRASVPLATQ